MKFGSLATFPRIAMFPIILLVGIGIGRSTSPPTCPQTSLAIMDVYAVQIKLLNSVSGAFRIVHRPVATSFRAWFRSDIPTDAVCFVDEI